MKNLLNLGKILNKAEQKTINGGSGNYSCAAIWHAICQSEPPTQSEINSPFYNPCSYCINVTGGCEFGC